MVFVVFLVFMIIIWQLLHDVCWNSLHGFQDCNLILCNVCWDGFNGIQVLPGFQGCHDFQDWNMTLSNINFVEKVFSWYSFIILACDSVMVYKQRISIITVSKWRFWTFNCYYSIHFTLISNKIIWKHIVILQSNWKWWFWLHSRLSNFVTIRKIFVA
jgi:hypothetical protein